MLKQSTVYHPTSFFLSTLFIVCVANCIAAYMSYQASLTYLVFPLILLGMSSPTLVALFMLVRSKDTQLWSDFCDRLRPSKIKLRFLLITLLLMPCLVALAIIVSTFFGFSLDQFSLAQLSDQALEGKNLVALFLIVFLSCSLEEIGWRGYGIDSLHSKYNLWQTSLIFASIWSLWHVPAFFIKNGYFQEEVWSLGFVYVATYFISLFPITIVINWLYNKNNRSILIAILFHTVMNLSYGLLQIQPFTRIIIMVLLLLSAAIVVQKDKEVFLRLSESAD